MKIRTTTKEIKNAKQFTIAIPYCDAQYLLRYQEPIAYTCGVYGWNYDVYQIDGALICTGYRGMPGEHFRELLKQYEDKARAVDPWGKDSREQVNKLLYDFIYNAKTGGAFSSEIYNRGGDNMTIQQILSVHNAPEIKTTNVKKWYIEKYPTDELGQEINPAATLEEIYCEPWRVYDLTIGDSLIRERIFEELAKRHDIKYGLIYTAWVDGNHTTKARRNWQAFINGLITATECEENQDKIKAGLI